MQFWSSVFTEKKRAAKPSSDRPMRGQTDQELWQDYVDGSDRAFVELFERHSRRVMLYVRRFLGSQVEAEDVFQDAWVRLAGLKTKTTVRNAELMLIRIARNLSLDALRKRRGDSFSFDEVGDIVDETERSSSLVEREESKRAIDRALEKLSPAQREIFILCEYEGYSYETVAQITNATINAVRIRHHRALQNIRHSIQLWLGLDDDDNIEEHL